MGESADAAAFVAAWAATGGSELANTQSFISQLCALIGVAAPDGSRSDDRLNDYVFERRVFQDNGDGTRSFGRIDCYKRGCFILEAKQGSDTDRAAADRGEADLDLFGQSAGERVKRGTARRGTPGWVKAMTQARGQAERYAKALPAEHGWPPFLLIVDVGHCIEVWADFSGTGKAYAQFPDRRRFRIMLGDLRDPDVRGRLARIWDAPASLDPAAQSAMVTREIADRLAELSKRLEARGHGAAQVAGFLMRCLFTMFAEDIGLLPDRSFSGLLARVGGRPENLAPQLSELWRNMDSGGFVGALGEAGEKVLRFNGYLFKEASTIELRSDEIGLLIEAAGRDWREVEPAIFGTLLERALDPKERARLGAHYTPRAYVDRLVMPTVIEPLRADWLGVRTAAMELIGRGDKAKARKVVEDFHGRLARTRVLDPACGTGNFLYVAMARMKELEGEVVELLVELGDRQYVAELSGHTITPENFLGIEINPRAAAIAQLVLWIGWLQWHFRVTGEGRMPPEPILRDIRTIETRDALIEWDTREIERDVRGRPVTRWDGETMKPHPATGRMVPDESARIELWHYINPRAAKWPKADFIVGNPPFIGGKDVRERLGDGYFEALFQTSTVPESADFVMHWWDRAATIVRTGGARRFGFITTNSLPQTFSRRVVARHMAALDPIALVFAVPNHPWVDERDGAAVRIAMTVGEAGRRHGVLKMVRQEAGAPDTILFDLTAGRINPDLRIGADIAAAVGLKANERLASRGCALHGKGFIVSPAKAQEFGTSPAIKAYRNGRDLASRPRGVMVIDVDGWTEGELRFKEPAIYQHLVTTVRPEREQNKEPSRRRYWWMFGRRNTELRAAIRDLPRYIATVETTKHRTFQFLPADVLPDNMIVVIGSDDALILGILSSRIHGCWALAAGGRLGMGDDPRYNKTRCFDPFPFPAEVSASVAARIRAEAEALDEQRKRVLAEHDDLTLTGLYNVVEALRRAERAGEVLSAIDRDIHDRGQVTLIRRHHDVIDALVAEAYGWPSGLADEEVLGRLVDLNGERAREEAKGLVRWLRPDFQAPSRAAPIEEALELGEPGRPPGAVILQWPASLPEQVTAVAGVLASSHAPVAASDVARAFRGKRSASVSPVLEALAAMGQARRLGDGRFAA